MHCDINEKKRLSRLMTKPTKCCVRPANTQISLGIHLVWSESSRCALWVAKDPVLLKTDSDDSDQTVGFVVRLLNCHCNRLSSIFNLEKFHSNCPKNKYNAFLFKTTLFDPRHEKTCFSYMWTTKVQIRLRGVCAVWLAPLLFAT